PQQRRGTGPALPGAGTLRALPPDLPTAVLRHAHERPGATALLWNGASVSYGELRALSDEQSHRLGSLGLAQGEPVCVPAHKSPETIALVLACLREARPFLLPSAALPPALLAELAASAGCRWTVTADGESPVPPAAAGGVPLPPGTGFLLTTSGSTGTPKVVPLPHRAVNRFTRWAAGAFGIDAETTVLNYAPLNFDLCLLDVWTTLARGGRVVLVDPDLAARGEHLVDLIDRHGVDVVQAVPMFYTLLTHAARRRGTTLPSVRHAVFTGDVMPEATLAELPPVLPGARLHGVYGCTETNDSFVHEVDRELPLPAGVPLGRPLPGVRTAVLDAGRRVLRGPGEGELYVSTPFQAAGYLDPARDPGKFTGHPPSLDPGPWFATGDLVRVEADGTVRLTGRVDHQVKVRGIAVNTARVEAVLASHPAVAEVGVVAVPDPVGGRRLLAVVRTRAGTGATSLDLRRHCSAGLPRAAVPTSLLVVDSPLPRTPTGKVDRRALEEFAPTP
ncbi:AMP-binding protein, partial [Streptomyces otsuchiensis]|uniref:AMP-binding protein n=1 Tax=Streptomyces otsuchiensis TaxID=2681388 RepID=UPI0027D99CB5